MTRREMNSTILLGLTALFCEPTKAAMPSPSCIPGNSPGATPSANVAKISVSTLMKEPLARMPDAVVSLITLTVPPGSVSAPHRHTGPVFAYVLEGKIENQVDPDPPRIYEPGQFFYEPPMHVHRLLRNLSKTQPAKLLIFQVGEKGKKFTIQAT